MNLTRIYAIVLRQFYLTRGSIARTIPLFIWVAMDIIVWGFNTKYLNSITSAVGDFVPRFLGAVLLWDFLTRVMQGVTIAFFEDVWTRNFLNVFAAPLTTMEYVSGLVLTGVITSCFGLAIMLLLAMGFFGFSFFSYGLMLMPFLLVLFLSGMALGIAGCAIVLRLGPASEWLVWPIPVIISPFVCVFYPIATLPHWMQAVACILPPSYVFEGIRAIVSGHAADRQTLACGIALSLLYIALACWYFINVYRHALKTGLIARYSAESLS